MSPKIEFAENGEIKEIPFKSITPEEIEEWERKFWASDDGVAPSISLGTQERTKKYRKAFNHKYWGNWEYKSSYDCLSFHRKGHQNYDIALDRIVFKRELQIDKALAWIAHLHDKNWIDYQDLKDLAHALGELLQCPLVAKSYRTTYGDNWIINRIAEQENYTTCYKCYERFKCWSLIPTSKTSDFFGC